MNDLPDSWNASALVRSLRCLGACCGTSSRPVLGTRHPRMSWWNKLAESGEGLGLGKLKTLVDSAADTFIPKEDSPRSVSLAEEEIPVTDEVVEYVYNLTEHPATFTDFPISKHTGKGLAISGEFTHPLSPRLQRDLF